ncbi:hypothetical protein DXB18_14225 [Clostridium sp. OM02-18AC]|uniref:hypothetical protein n=1 Tax=Clostridium sp. OM02-18AC TaxID=2292311 RepID=UPI000E4DDC81|nr:hypothetical protein [Clostridium sp. OM02-18AC]RHV63232.1 hypothetical protein DXB18_14225 [Clostridium sp. OM02-18AC]
MITNVDKAANLFDKDSTIDLVRTFQNSGWILNKPISENLRKSFIYFLGQKDSDGTYKLLFRLFWNPFIPILGLLMAEICAIIKKHGYGF